MKISIEMLSIPVVVLCPFLILHYKTMMLKKQQRTSSYVCYLDIVVCYLDTVVCYLDTDTH